MPNSIVLNGIKTRGTCPCCQTENVLFEHGYDERGKEYPLHLERCPECGDSIVIVGYDCPHCKPGAKQKCLGCGSEDLFKKPDGTFALLCPICIFQRLSRLGIFDGTLSLRLAQ